MELSEVPTQDLFDELKQRSSAIVLALKFIGDGGKASPPAYWSAGDDDLCFAMANRLYKLTNDYQSRSTVGACTEGDNGCTEGDDGRWTSEDDNWSYEGEGI